jgi:hypothetical protein
MNISGFTLTSSLKCHSTQHYKCFYYWYILNTTEKLHVVHVLHLMTNVNMLSVKFYYLNVSIIGILNPTERNNYFIL